MGKICPYVGKDVEIVVNRKRTTNYKEKQKIFDDITSKIFKIDECQKDYVESAFEVLKKGEQSKIAEKTEKIETDGKWHDPLDYCQRTKYNYYGEENIEGGTFGKQIFQSWM